MTYQGIPDPTTQPPWWDDQRGAIEVTDEEFVDWLRCTSRENAIWYTKRLKERARQGHDCWMGGHESTIEALHRDCDRALARVRFLEQNYMEGRS